jgi:streptogrisin C
MRKHVMLFTVAIALFTGSTLASEPPGPALLEDATSYASQTGVSVGEAVRRLRLQQEIGDLDAVLAAEEPATYAGLWIDDQHGYRVVARFTDPAAEARLRARVAGGRLADLIELRPARWSLEELRKRRGQVRGHAVRAKIRTNSSINVFENRAEIYMLDDGSKLAAAMARAGARMPEGVMVQRVSELAHPIAALTGGAQLASCTSGFTVQAPNGELGVLTAGHCYDPQWFEGKTLPTRRQIDGGNHDIQWNSACDLVPVTNQFESGYGLRAVIATRHRNNQAIGTYVCKFGRRTGLTCGWIQSKDEDPDGWTDWNPFDGTFMRIDGRGRNTSEGGDSGSPVYVENIAYGIVTHEVSDDREDTLYMAINYISDIGVSVLTSNPGVCNLIPTASFAAHARLDGFATFNASTSSDPDGYIARYEWNFDDGTTGVSTTPSITHVYPPDSGSYYVTLTVVDNEGKRISTSKEVCVPTISCANPR